MNATSKLVKAWESKNAKNAARAGGVSLMALSLAACGGSDDVAVDLTPFAQSDIDTAVAAANTAAATAQAEAVAAAEAAVDLTTNDAEVVAAALTAANGTSYATVDAAYTAGSNTNNGDAVAAALTDAAGTAHATVDAAVTSNDTAIADAATTAANATAEATLVAGTGFDTVAALNAAYTAAIAATPALNSALTSASDSAFGTSADDSVSATLTTYTTGDVISDGTTTDNDTLTVTINSDVTATPVVVGFENVNFVVSTLDAGGDATVTIDAASIQASTITVSASNSSNILTTTDIDNLATNMTVSSGMATIDIATVANADVTVASTAATATVVQAGTTDTLSISGGNLTVNTVTAEEAITIDATGTVSMTDAAANAAGADVAISITAGGNVDVVDVTDTGSLTVVSGGNIVVGATDLFTDGAVTLTTTAGDITVTNADDATSLVINAVGAGPADTSTAADGAVIVTKADTATTATINSTDSITITDMNAATSASLSAAAASSIVSVDALGDLTLASTGTAATPVAYTVTTGEMQAIETLTITGSQDVTLAMGGDDLVAATTANQALVATDTSSGTSRLDINAASGAALDLTGVALDEIEISADNSTDALTVASGAQLVVSANQGGLTLTAAAVAGNTVDIELNSGTVGTGITLTDLATTNLSTVNVTMAADATATHTISDLGVGAASTVTISGSGALDLTTTATGTYSSVNASGVTGAVAATLATSGAVTTGIGDDTFNISDASVTAFTLNGGEGTDTVVFAASDDFSGVTTLSLTGIETLNVAASGVVLAGSQVTGKGYNIVGDAGTDTLAVNAAAGTGETIDLSGSSVALAAVTVTGLAGGDVITGSSTAGMTLAGGAGSDTVTGGAGADQVNFIFHASDADTITLGGGGDTVSSTTATAATIAAVTVTDFDAGTSSTTVDDIELSDTALTGLTTTTDMVDTGANSAAATDGTVTHVTTDGGTIAAADLVVLSGSYTTDALALAGIKTAGSDTITYGAALTDNDSFLIAYQNGADVNIAVATAGASALTTSEGVDSLATIMILEDVTAANLDSGDFAFIA